MKISIFGLGYVGAVSFGGLTRMGHDVVGVDVDPAKLRMIERGESPVVEEGMPELIREAVASGRSRVTDDAACAVRSTELSFVCVGTPSDRTGAHDLRALKTVCGQIGAALAEKSQHHVVVIRSTVTPGTTMRELAGILQESSGLQAGQDFSLCFQPEFLREGVSIRDFENPPMTIAGGDPKGVATLRSVFGTLPGEFFETSVESAEMVKFCCNAFHALKVSFANEVGRLCSGLDIDGREVMSLLCEDKQLNVSAAYLRPGFAFGGSCLPKDLRALVKMSQNVGVDLPMLGQVLRSNEVHVGHAMDLILATEARSVAMIGLSFKGGTDDLRESPLLELAERLIGKGFNVRIYDPEVNLSRLIGSNRHFLENRIPHISSIMSDDYTALLGDSEVVVMGVKDKEVEQQLLNGAAAQATLIDLVGLPSEVASGCRRSVGVCW